MRGLSWPWPIGYTYGPAVTQVTVACGLLLVVVGALYLVSGLFGGESGPLRVVVRLLPPEMGSSLATALITALAIGMLAGVAFTLSPWSFGRLGLPSHLTAGLALGLGSGITLACAAGCVARLPRGLVIGSAAGALVGLTVFRLAFGPTAGFGAETDLGVGPEVGLVLGMAGGLAGGLLGTALTRRGAASEQHPDAGARPHRWLALGMAAGAVVGLAIGVIGWLSHLFALMLPYYGGFTDCPTPGGCGQGALPLPLDVLGVIYGLSLFAVMGGLTGGLVSALAARAKRRGEHPGAAYSLALGWIVGLASGLAAGLQHSIVGGPAIVGARQYIDTAGGLRGLIAGAVVGLALGALITLALARVAGASGASDASRRRLLLLGVALVAVGIVVWAVPAWYVPLKVIDVP